MNIEAIKNIPNEYLVKNIKIKEKPQKQEAVTLPKNFKSIYEIKGNFINAVWTTPRINSLFETFIKKSGKVTVREYEEIYKKRPELIKKAYQLVDNHYNGKLLPKDVATCAIAMKRNLDDEFGEGKYRIISIGTSPYQMTQAMEYLGSEVIYVPISGLRGFNDEEESYKDYVNFKRVMEYLKTKMPKDNKDAILIDFTYSGKTLRTFASAVEEAGIIPFDRINTRSLLLFAHDCLLNISDKKDAPLDDFYFYLQEDMYYSAVANISNVPHFEVMYDKDEIKICNHELYKNCKTNKDFFKIFDNYSKPLARAYNLCVLNELNKYANGITD